MVDTDISCRKALFQSGQDVGKPGPKPVDVVNRLGRAIAVQNGQQSGGDIVDVHQVHQGVVEGGAVWLTFAGRVDQRRDGRCRALIPKARTEHERQPEPDNVLAMEMTHMGGDVFGQLFGQAVEGERRAASILIDGCIAILARIAVNDG